MSIKINKTNITIRPSSIDTAQQCGYQWAKVFLEGGTSIPNSRAALGTALHKGVEVMWTEAIAANKKDPNISMMIDAGVESFKESSKDGMRYNSDETVDTINKEIVSGTQAFIDDIIPWLDIPEQVEARFTVPIGGHPIVKSISGTVDYISNGIIDDLKTSKRKPTIANYVTQQSTYKYLAVENGIDVKMNRIQSVVLKKKPEGHILELEPNIDQAKYLINNLLDKVEHAAKESAPMEVIFSCNTKYYLCSPKYCAFHGSCPATKRHTPEAKRPLI